MLPISHEALSLKEYRSCFEDICSSIAERKKMYKENIEAMELFFKDNSDKPEISQYFPKIQLT